MDPRARWQALQSRLTAARAALEQGDRRRALAEVDAALAIDPSFLAAAALRERILGSGVAGFGFRVPEKTQTPQNPQPSQNPQNPQNPKNLQNPQNPKNPQNPQNPQNPKNPLSETRNPLPTSAPLVSTEGYARFEQRAKRRRVDRRIDAARQALARGNVRVAASALDEVIALDPNLPELSELTARFDEVRRARTTSHRGPTIAAAIAFGALVFGASWLHDGQALLSYPIAAIANLIQGASPPPLDVIASDALADTETETPVATSGRREQTPMRLVEPPRAASTPRSAASTTRAFTPAQPISSPQPSAAAPAPAAPPPPAATPSPAQPPPPITPSPAPVTLAAALPSPAPADVPRASMPAPSRVESDEAQISRALQQYRRAYERLDAQQAQAVWPAVNEAALSRAFASLQSQTLTFDACRTQLNGDAAVATCQGRARYVPKIGSREPRVEPRTWTFVLKRAGADWKIDAARVEQ